MTPPFTSTAPLFVPATRPERFAKAAVTAADAVIIDLEDAVSPSDKDAARQQLQCQFTTKPVIVRINAVGTPWHERDLEVLTRMPGLAAIMLPKAETPDAVQSVASVAPVIALIESATGMARARELAKTQGVRRLAFGSLDLAADLGCAHSREALLYARSELVLASRLAGLPAPLDGVTTDLTSALLVEDDASYGRSLGFGGKLAIHPSQVNSIHLAYRPDPTEIAWARAVLASNGAVSLVDGTMVDEPVRIRARELLRRAGEE